MVFLPHLKRKVKLSFILVMSILGLIALKDTLRQETIAAIRELQSIGVEAIMITGDNEETAKAIALKVI